jgi:spermidine/putrescine-binding protein
MCTMFRRDFLAAITAVPLAACARAPKRNAALDDPDAPLGPVEKTLAIYNWSDYIAPDTIPGFEREFGVRVSYDTYESNEEMFDKLVAGASGYAIVVPSSYLLDAMRANRMLMPLHHH